MWWLLALAVSVPSSPQVQVDPTDVSALKAGPPTVVAEFETAKLKGEPRKLSWSADHSQFYLQTVEGRPPAEKVRHYTIAVSGGALSVVEREPDWSVEYWNVKQDRVAPGIPSLEIQIEQTVENMRGGVGQAGVLDRQSSPDAVAGGNPSVESLASGQHGNRQANVVRLKLLGEEIAVWVDERPVPGVRFGWGPVGSGALAYVGDGGGIVFFDQRKRRQRLQGVKDAMLPAWSADGARLAYVQKVGKKKIAIAMVPLSR